MASGEGFHNTIINERLYKRNCLLGVRYTLPYSVSMQYYNMSQWENHVRWHALMNYPKEEKKEQKQE